MPCFATARGDRIHIKADDQISCPYCGQPNTIVVDSSARSQQFTTDCEVCCRPFRVSIECEAGEILSIDAQSE
ncbi:MAG: CPXCG motif-containing cysteine-rich protein [Limisphaerales bacterium]